MADPDKALATQLANIEKRTGRTVADLTAIVKESGLSRHGELVAMLKETLGMGHGDANAIVHVARKAEAGAKGSAPSAAEALDALYAGQKAALRLIHDRLLEEMAKLGAFEEAPKKAYVSYRRRKQFATIGPATSTRVEVGLNMKGVDATDRLEALPSGRMCDYRVRLGDPREVDAELLGWLRTAYESAG